MAATLYIGNPFGIERVSITAGQGVTAQPTVVAASAPTADTVLVEFSRPMGFVPRRAGVLTPLNYQVTLDGVDLYIMRVTKVSPTEIKLWTSLHKDGTYQLFVTGVEDADGQPINVVANTATFLAVSPTLPELDRMFTFVGTDAGVDEVESTGFLPDLDPPVVQNQDPANGAVAIDADTDLILDIVDAVTGIGSGVDLSSVIISIDLTSGTGAGPFVPIWSGDAAQPGYTGARIAIIDGYNYEITPDVPLPDDTAIYIRVQASDTAPVPNSVDVTYSFTTIQPGATIPNSSFEIAGVTLGSAKFWSSAYPSTAEDIAAFEGSLLPYETFEAGWAGGNQESREAFLDTDLEAASFDDSVESLAEDFDHEWKSPNSMALISLYADGSGLPAVPNLDFPAPAELGNGWLIYDRVTQSWARIFRKESTTGVLFHYANFYQPGSGSFAQGLQTSDGLIGSILAELWYGRKDLATGDGLKTGFLGTLVGTPIHPASVQVTDPPSYTDFGTLRTNPTFRIEVTIAGVVHKLVDDGEGLLASDVLTLEGTHTIDYATGAYQFTLLTAPDDGTKLIAFWQYGDDLTKAQLTGDTSGVLPIVSSGATIYGKTTPSQNAFEPPYNHSSHFIFTAGDLRGEAFLDDGGDPIHADGMEYGWNAKAVIKYDDDPRGVDVTPAGFEEVATKDVALHADGEASEDFENDWRGNDGWSAHMVEVPLVTLNSEREDTEVDPVWGEFDVLPGQTLTGFINSNPFAIVIVTGGTDAGILATELNGLLGGFSGAAVEALPGRVSIKAANPGDIIRVTGGTANISLRFPVETPATLAAASFDAALTPENVEDFEEGWTTTLQV
jgi:hypothetical protein